MSDHRLDVLAALASEITRKRNAPPSDSYTAKLISQGVEKCAKKFGEEAVELAIAAVGTDRKHIAAEAADVLYHLLVVLEAKGVALSDVMTELERRQGKSGLAEKAARKAD
jgi:phosphoribosyl-ATP pyrophosphohydrolase